MRRELSTMEEKLNGFVALYLEIGLLQRIQRDPFKFINLIDMDVAFGKLKILQGLDGREYLRYKSGEINLAIAIVGDDYIYKGEECNKLFDED